MKNQEKTFSIIQDFIQYNNSQVELENIRSFRDYSIFNNFSIFIECDLDEFYKEYIKIIPQKKSFSNKKYLTNISRIHDLLNIIKEEQKKTKNLNFFTYIKNLTEKFTTIYLPSNESKQPLYQFKQINKKLNFELLQKISHINYENSKIISEDPFSEEGLLLGLEKQIEFDTSKDNQFTITKNTIKQNRIDFAKLYISLFNIDTDNLETNINENQAQKTSNDILLLFECYYYSIFPIGELKELSKSTNELKKPNNVKIITDKINLLSGISDDDKKRIKSYLV